MERVHELNKLRGFQVVLSSFLKRFSESQSARIDLLEGIERLDRIVAESGGMVDGEKTDTAAAVDEWMKTYMPLAKRSSLAAQDRERISALLLELQRGSDEGVSDERMNAEVTSLAMLRQKITNWRDRSETENIEAEKKGPKEKAVAAAVTPVSRTISVDQTRTSAPRKIVLKRKSETDQLDLSRKFIEMLWSELEYFENDSRSGQHALSRLNDMLNCAETKTDPMFLHLAGSFIYFLRREGYKMAPYVKRLKDIENKMNEAPANTLTDSRTPQLGVTA